MQRRVEKSLNPKLYRVNVLMIIGKAPEGFFLGHFVSEEEKVSKQVLIDTGLSHIQVMRM